MCYSYGRADLGSTALINYLCKYPNLICDILPSYPLPLFLSLPFTYDMYVLIK